MCAGLDAEWLKRTMLFGVDLTDDAGDPFPDEMWDLVIGSAREILDHELGTSMCEVKTYDERYDLTYGDWGRAYQTQLNYGPIRSIEAVSFKMADMATVEIPTNWVYVRDAELAIMEIIWGSGTPGNIVFTSHGFYYYGRYFDARSPALLSVRYTAGFDEDNYPIPDLAKMCIGWMASMLPLDTAGDLIAGAGIASYSIGMDGLSQSIGTTSSATNAGYGARILSYQKQLARGMNTLRRRYRGLPMHAM